MHASTFSPRDAGDFPLPFPERRTASPVPSDTARRCARRPLALPIWTRALDRDPDQGTAVGGHRPAIVVPIRMFAG
jgi:hypothetical protein